MKKQSKWKVIVQVVLMAVGMNDAVELLLTQRM